MGFDITADELTEIVNFDERTSHELIDSYEKKGGAHELAKRLQVDPDAGLNSTQLTESQVQERIETFGSNVIPPPPRVSLLRLMYLQVKEDVILQILLVGAIINLGFGMFEDQQKGWIEGVAILMAVMIVVGVSSGNDWVKEKKFQSTLMLQSEKNVKVIRDGEIIQLLSTKLLVGDIVKMETGDEIPADGVLLPGTSASNKFKVDESPLTGETDVIPKHATNAPFLFAGTQLAEGDGTMVVTGVGARSTGGQIQVLLNEQTKQETPLQEKLTVLAKQISIAGFVAGAATFLGLLIRWIIVETIIGSFQPGSLLLLLHYFVLAITIIVVAVPEGLPLAVTIALAYSMLKMVKENNFVRFLSASETMGEGTCICSDKTGTLTQNRMTVTEAIISGITNPSSSDLGPGVLTLLNDGVSINSSCEIHNMESASPDFVGNRTECALLMYTMQTMGAEPYGVTRKRLPKPIQFPFSSARKRMSVVVMLAPGAHRVYMKGAAEIVLGLCTSELTGGSATAAPMSAMRRSELLEKLEGMAGQGLRTITLAYRDVAGELTEEALSEPDPDQWEKNLTFIGMVGIKDPVRPEVPGAVAQCQEAGLVVRMVTGDNILTAKYIARECGILTEGGIAMEGPKFRSLTPEQMEKVIPRLQVLARSSPKDKYDLVSKLKEMGQVVAVTGDGTNDAPALKEADVGFSMGIQGTDVAKNASDIVLLDDNFSSIVSAIKWGRNVFDSIRKFLQFQLSINFAAIVIVFVGAIAFGASPINAVQLLFLNLIMDTLGALALATDPPTEAVLHRAPHSRKERILTVSMLTYILIQGMFQVIVCLTILFGGIFILGMTPILVNTLVFAVFVYLQIPNEFNARTLGSDFNIFRGVHRNPYFVSIVVVIFIIQGLMVQFGGAFLQTQPLTALQWAFVMVIMLIGFPLGFAIRFFIKIVFAFRQKKLTEKANREGSSIPHSESDLDFLKDEEPESLHDIDGQLVDMPVLEERPLIRPKVGQVLTGWERVRVATKVIGWYQDVKKDNQEL